MEAKEKRKKIRLRRNILAKFKWSSTFPRKEQFSIVFHETDCGIGMELREQYVLLYPANTLSPMYIISTSALQWRADLIH